MQRLQQFLIEWYSRNKTLCEAEKHKIYKYIYVSSFTSLHMCSAHSMLSCRMLLAFPTSISFVKFGFAEISLKSAWWVTFRPPRCWLLPWPLQFIRTGPIWILDFCCSGPCCLMQEVLIHTFLFVFSVLWPIWILDFCYSGPCYLMQEVLIHTFLFVFSVLYTKMHWGMHSLAYTFSHLTVFLRTE